MCPRSHHTQQEVLGEAVGGLTMDRAHEYLFFPGRERAQLSRPSLRVSESRMKDGGGRPAPAKCLLSMASPEAGPLLSRSLPAPFHPTPSQEVSLLIPWQMKTITPSRHILSDPGADV